MARKRRSLTSTLSSTEKESATKFQHALANTASLRAAGRFQEAIKEMEPFLHGPDQQSRILAMQEMALTYWRLGQGGSALALDLLRSATEGAMAYPEVLVTILLTRAALAHSVGDLSQALQAVQMGKEAVGSNPDSSVAVWMGRFLNKEGHLLEEQERYAEAALVYQQAANWHLTHVGPFDERDRNSMLASSYLGCGTCHMRVGNLAEAQFFFEKERTLPLLATDQLMLKVRQIELEVRSGRRVSLEELDDLRKQSVSLPIPFSRYMLDEAIATVMMLTGQHEEARTLLATHEHAAAAAGATGTVQRIRRVLNSDALIIREALAQERFLFHYMPILDLRNDRVSQYELLLRMIDTQGQVLLPSKFLHIVERSGLMPEVDRWVIRRAIRLLRDEQAAGRDLRLEVNLSAHALEDRELLGIIEHELASAEVNPELLVMEITESIASYDPERALEFIKSLKMMGCQFAMDDFGVGSSSLSRLKHMPVDYLKIDGSFIRNLAHDTVDQHLVKTVVQLARALGVATVAEYVEDEETLRLLREYGVDYAQGFYVGQPEPMNQSNEESVEE